MLHRKALGVPNVRLQSPRGGASNRRCRALSSDGSSCISRGRESLCPAGGRAKLLLQRRCLAPHAAIGRPLVLLALQLSIHHLRILVPRGLFIQPDAAATIPPQLTPLALQLGVWAEVVAVPRLVAARTPPQVPGQRSDAKLGAQVPSLEAGDQGADLQGQRGTEAECGLSSSKATAWRAFQRRSAARMTSWSMPQCTSCSLAPANRCKSMALGSGDGAASAIGSIAGDPERSRGTDAMSGRCRCCCLRSSPRTAATAAWRRLS